MTITKETGERMSINEISQDELVGIDLPRMIFIRVADAYDLLWERNPKLHNIGELIQSFDQHGFQELPKYDGTLGGFKAGNGRVEALHIMWSDGGWERPRGVAETNEGEWAIPVIVGTDAKSIDMAVSYAIDSNNLTMSGGDFTGLDMSRMWDRVEYLNVLSDIAEREVFSISVDPDMLDYLNGSPFMPSLDPEFSGKEYGQDDVDRAQAKIDKQYSNKEDNPVNVLCPFCYKEFFISGK